jgi:hypothetical protein
MCTNAYAKGPGPAEEAFVLEGEGDAGAGMRYGVEDVVGEDVVGEDVVARPWGIGPPCAHAAKASTVFSVAAAPGPKMAAQEVARKSDAGAHEFAGWFARASPRRAAGRWDTNPPRDAPARNAHVARTVATEATQVTRELRGASSAGGRSGARSAPASAIAAPARGVVPPRTGIASSNHDLRPARGLVSCGAAK